MDKPYYITTPIYYVNGEPHIGHVFTTLLADTMHRYRRLTGQPAYYMTGTDEHGQKVQQTADAHGVSPQEWCDRMATIFSQAFDTSFGIAPSRFMRTTYAAHEERAILLWKRLSERGFIYKATYEGWYCVSDEAFVTKNNVAERLCPDGSIAVYSLESGQPCIWLAEENYMFRLSAFADLLLNYYATHPNAITPSFRQREIIRFLKSGLHDISVSRSRSKISWGIPVPGDPEHVLYVWIDALTIYLTGAKWDGTFGPAPAWIDGKLSLNYDAGQKNVLSASTFEGEDPFIAGDLGGDVPSMWPADIQYLGKDIMRFHCVYWPAFLLAAGLELPRLFFVHGWWKVNDQKIGKSLGNASNPLALVERIGLDPFKYFLLCEGSPDHDPVISDELIDKRYNSDLANTLGNLVMRCWAPALVPERVWPNPLPLLRLHNPLVLETILRVTLDLNLDYLFVKLDEAWVKEGRPPASEVLHYSTLRELILLTNKCVYRVRRHMRYSRFSAALASIFEIVERCNSYLQLVEPWKFKRIFEPEVGGAARDFVIYFLLEALRIAVTLLQPFMPEKSVEILQMLGVEEHLHYITPSILRVGVCSPGIPLAQESGVLFPKNERPNACEDVEKPKWEPKPKAEKRDKKAEKAARKAEKAAKKKQLE
ncbi:Methionyl-tRNA synthetase [Giardia muris]|uniref:methionine--tRNA ligase n=1 Tax=Giardia muris TaxID=5742 RepID=A0A4Z1SM25_GIAMU|nr:Methionyl-tRNA synthetase [Giardia muris]|eukprot:TNJ26726.1 Methionyl-tRNA synthetase [Giardia muris]